MQSNQEPSAQPAFNFRNGVEHSQGLENVIHAFTQGQLSQAEARRVITAADRYATQSLTPKLYSPEGLRRQIAQLFDYSYGIDQNKPDRIQN